MAPPGPQRIRGQMIRGEQRKMGKQIKRRGPDKNREKEGAPGKQRTVVPPLKMTRERRPRGSAIGESPLKTEKKVRIFGGR